MPVTLRGEETFGDSLRWQEMAKELGIRLPLWRMPITTGGMRRFLKKVNLSVDDYLKANGERTLKTFGQNNPDWPLRAWAGIQVENLVWLREHPDAYQEEKKSA